MYWQGGRHVITIPVATTANSTVEIGAAARPHLKSARAWRMSSIWVDSDDVLRNRRAAPPQPPREASMWDPWALPAVQAEADPWALPGASLGGAAYEAFRMA